MLSAQDLLGITATVTASFDTSVALYRNTATRDAYGHASENWAYVRSVACTISKPTATMLATFGGIIGSQRSLSLRFLASADVREGDRVVTSGGVWLVQYILNAESYSIGYNALCTVVS